MHDYKYPELFTAVAGERHLHMACSEIDEIHSECLKPCALAFSSNLIRTFMFSLLPMEIAYQSSRNFLFEVNAHARVTGKKEIGLLDLLSLERSEQWEVEYNSQGYAFDEIGLDDQAKLKTHMGLKFVLGSLNTNPGMQHSMNAMLTSIVLESWIFFEAFTSDLWVSAVDNGTKTISNNVAFYPNFNKPEDHIKAEHVASLESNAKTHLGSFYRETGKVSFSKLRDIKRFYSAAFGADAGKLFDDTAGGYLQALSAVRNCIVHRAGKVDSEFKRYTKGRFSEFESLQLNNNLLLDGALVKKLRMAAAETGLALLKHVDATLQAG